MFRYVSTLEARVQSLESQLRAAKSRRSEPQRNGSSRTSHSHGATNFTSYPTTNTARPLAPQGSREQENCTANFNEAPREPQRASSELAILDMLYNSAVPSDPDVVNLPGLPSSNTARNLVDAAFHYVQARYCVVDWAQVRDWHQDRESLAYTPNHAPIGLQTGAFFIWIIYAIGARFVSNPEHSSEAYFARARCYLPAVMSLQNLETVQALLCLVQYYFRASEPPIWHLVGFVLRLCVKLRYHRKVTSENLDPYTIELQKRFFWCAYCFDRCASMLAKLPFGISDLDIDVETPIDIEVTCTDQERIRELQIRQSNGESTNEQGTVTTMTAALHHLQVYRIRSRITTNFMGPNARIPSSSDVASLLSELNEWKQQEPHHDSRSLTRQGADRVRANYLQAVLLLIRPVLMGNTVDPDLVGLCVTFAVDACDSAKALSLNPQTHVDRITTYHVFYFGITLLQCLAIQPTVLTPRRAHHAISSCLSALAIYARMLPSVAPFLHLFEMLSDLFVRNDHTSGDYPMVGLRKILNNIVSSDPSETSGARFLRSLSDPETHQGIFDPKASETENTATRHDSLLDGQTSVTAFGGEDQLDMFLEVSSLYAPDAAMTNLWTGPWLDPSSTEFPPALGALGANYNEKLTWINHKELQQVNATWIRGFIDMHQIDTEHVTQDPNIKALFRAIEAGYKIILSLKWNYSQLHFPAIGAAAHTIELQHLNAVLQVVMDKVNILVIGNEPFIEVRNGHADQRLNAFYESLADAVISFRREQPDSNKPKLYMGAFNRLDLPVKRTQAIERMLQFIASRPELEGADLHPHMPTLQGHKSMLEYVLPRLRPDQRFLATEFSLVWHWKKHLADPVSEYFCTKYAFPKGVKVHEVISAAMQAPWSYEQWEDFLSHEPWDTGRLEVATCGFCPMRLRKLPLPVDGNPWMLNGIFAPSTVRLREDGSSILCTRGDADEYDPLAKQAESNEITQLVEEINLDALISRASTLREGRSCFIPNDLAYDSATRSSVMGGMNYHIEITFDDGISWLARIRKSNATSPPPELRDYILNSEVATLQFLSNETKVPVPKIFDFNFSDTNPVGVGYILMEKLPGHSLRWSIATLEQRRKVIDQLSDVYIELKNHPFTLLGSMNSPGSYGIGPFARESLTDFHGPEMKALGPFSLTAESVRAEIELILDLIARQESYVDRPIDAFLIHRFLLDKVSDIFGENKLDDEKFYLKHADDKGDQILVDDDFGITGIIDREWAHTDSKSGAFNSPIVLFDEADFYDGGNSVSEDESFLVECFEAKGHSDLGSIVRNGHIIHRFRFCCGYSPMDWKGYIGLFGGFLGALGIKDFHWETWKVEALDRYKDDHRLQQVIGTCK
ncbi:hypothetical protein N7456_003854 [Penicillium angulare]|uniref:Xylanolytic transcriptional activator regulatory domain-containing protein n=1 Tax=Penicillium angulare TaxID=116970 RepID=A0A9W9FVI9_9EURO|nr:hypothetical protein N7456_003854 [Penicillium angulare]